MSKRQAATVSEVKVNSSYSWKSQVITKSRTTTFFISTTLGLQYGPLRHENKRRKKKSPIKTIADAHVAAKQNEPYQIKKLFIWNQSSLNHDVGKSDTNFLPMTQNLFYF